MLWFFFLLTVKTNSERLTWKGEISLNSKQCWKFIKFPILHPSTLLSENKCRNMAINNILWKKKKIGGRSWQMCKAMVTCMLCRNCLITSLLEKKDTDESLAENKWEFSRSNGKNFCSQNQAVLDTLGFHSRSSIFKWLKEEEEKH